MKRAAIQPNERQAGEPRFRAISGKRQSLGQTAGEALDALNEEAGPDAEPSLVVVQQIGGDTFFTDAHYQRMQELLARSESMTSDEQGELERLASEEIIASGERTKAIADALGR